MNEHIILVAVHVVGGTREQAHATVHAGMPRPGHFIAAAPVQSSIEAWWVAEDDRTDGSDCDSAIFVPRGAQDDMRHVLNNHFEAHDDEWQEEGYPYAETDVSGAWFTDRYPEDGLNHYRVTIDAPAEQYVYEVDAANEAHAIIHAHQLAANDGCTESDRRGTKVEAA